MIMGAKEGNFYAIFLVGGFALNLLLGLSGAPRLSGLGLVIWLPILAQVIWKWHVKPKGDDLIKEARQLDASWTKEDNRAFRDLIDKRLKG
jgi:hypothetical protein